MRITDGPIPTEDLTYVGSLSKNATRKILKSLKVSKYDFVEMQELVNAKYLGKIEPLRHEAMRLIEEAATE